AVVTGQPPTTAGNAFPSTGPAYEQPLLLWVVTPDSTVLPVTPRGARQSSPPETLPDAARAVNAPTTMKLSDGSELRFAGETADVLVNGTLVSGARVVAADSLTNVNATQHNILTAELL